MLDRLREQNQEPKGELRRLEKTATVRELIAVSNKTNNGLWVLFRQLHFIYLTFLDHEVYEEDSQGSLRPEARPSHERAPRRFGKAIVR